jgi:hypothetical protein
MSYLAIKSWVYGKLNAYAPLIAAMGGTDKNILDIYPNTINSLPVVVYSEANQANSYFTENTSLAESSAIDIHVFTAFNVSTTPISKIIDDLMTSILYTRVFAMDQDDPSTKVRHKVLKYSRNDIVAADLNT